MKTDFYQALQMFNSYETLKVYTLYIQQLVL